jgi:hypothetical protein
MNQLMDEPTRLEMTFKSNLEMSQPVDKRTHLHETFRSYIEHGHLVLTVTLSTYVTSDQFAESDRMRHFWDAHFIHRVERRLLPYRSHLDHDYVLERSPDGFWHYHGLIAVRESCATRLWKHDRLNPRLAKDLRTFERRGQYRPFRVNSFLIEPPKNLKAWCEYITKKGQVHLNTK